MFPEEFLQSRIRNASNTSKADNDSHLKSRHLGGVGMIQID